MNTRGSRPISDLEQQTLLACRPIDRICPIRVGGLPPVDLDGVTCACGREIPRGRQFARIRRQVGTHVDIDFMGICEPCRSAVPGVLRLRGDQGRFETWFAASGWRTTYVRRARPRWWDLIGWCRRLAAGARR